MLIRSVFSLQQQHNEHFKTIYKTVNQGVPDHLSIHPSFQFLLNHSSNLGSHDWSQSKHKAPREHG